MLYAVLHCLDLKKFIFSLIHMTVLTSGDVDSTNEGLVLDTQLSYSIIGFAYNLSIIYRLLMIVPVSKSRTYKIVV